MIKTLGSTSVVASEVWVKCTAVVSSSSPPHSSDKQSFLKTARVARQVHWPDRYVSLFGSRAYDSNLERPDDVPFEEQLRGLDAVIKAGKVCTAQSVWGMLTLVFITFP